MYIYIIIQLLITIIIVLLEEPPVPGAGALAGAPGAPIIKWYKIRYYGIT